MVQRTIIDIENYVGGFRKKKLRVAVVPRSIGLCSGVPGTFPDISTQVQYITQRIQGLVGFVTVFENVNTYRSVQTR